MRLPRKRGSTSNMVRVFIPDNSSTTGAGLTGLTNGSTNLVIAFMREFDSTATTYSGANIETITTIGTYQAPSSSSKVRFKAVDATNFPGDYELHFHDSATAFGSGDTSAHVIINVLETSTTALHVGPNQVMIPLVPWDPQDATRLGLTALPNAAAGANGGLPLAVDGSGRVDVLKVNGTSQTARDLGASVLLSSGTGTGQLDFTSGVVKANATQWLGGTIPAPNVTGVPLVDAKYLLGTIFATPATAGVLDANVKNIANAAVSTSTAQIGVNVVNFGGSAGTFASGRPEVNTTHLAGTISPATAGYVGVDWGQVTNKTTANALTGTTISTGQAVASVSGAVGSVTGNVGGDVTGKVLGGGASAFTAVGVQADLQTIKTQAVTAAAGVTFPASIGTSTLTQAQVTGGAYALATDGSGRVTVGAFASGVIVAGSFGAGAIDATVAPNLDAAVSSRLAPTTAGRTLDVSATGEAGVDWGNVGSPGTTVGLSGTTVGTATNVTNLPSPAPTGYGPGGGSGTVTVNEDYGGAGNLAYKTSGGTGIAGALVNAYLASEWAANELTATIRGQTTTLDSGGWASSMSLNAGTYTFKYSHPSYLDTFATQAVS